jgi:predicted neuraminidase
VHAAEPGPIEILDRSTIYRHTATSRDDPANTSGFNHAPNAAGLPDGRLMAVWFSGPFEGAPQQRIMQAFSSDQGRTWGEAKVLQDFPNRADFDPTLLVAGKTTLFFFTATSPHANYLRRSTDSGQSWTEPADLGQNDRERATRANGIQLSSGELLVPMHVRGTKAASVLKSRDGGQTWTRFGEVANPEGQGGEPTIAETKSGKVLMMLRTKDGQLWQSESLDQGESWSGPTKSGLTATSSASQILCLRDGTLVLAVNPGPTPLRFPLEVRVSRDEGKTWSAPGLLADRPEKKSGWSTCYPSLVELPDGLVAAVWTQIKSSPGELHGDIVSARFRVRGDKP